MRRLGTTTTNLGHLHRLPLPQALLSATLSKELIYSFFNLNLTAPKADQRMDLASGVN